VFTGLIEEIVTVERIKRPGGGARLAIATSLVAELSEGDSVAVDGTCLTVAAKSASGFEADVSAETLSRTTMGGWSSGTRVNLERAVRAGDRLGGHMVAGHVDATGTVLRRTQRGGGRQAGGTTDSAGSVEIWIRADAQLPGGIVSKGSVAVDGISLTVSGLADGSFAVTLIPETLKRTTLGGKQPGSKVNLETDLIGKYVEHYLAATVAGAPSRTDAGSQAPGRQGSRTGEQPNRVHGLLEGLIEEGG